MSTQKIIDRNYSSIGHLPGSRLGKGDHCLNPGQTRIATVTGNRQFRTRVVVLEKVDGSNVGILKRKDQIYAINRSGYRASSSPFEQHQLFAAWIRYHQSLFLEVMQEGDRLCGEWLLQAHGTRYKLPHEPFVPFDLFSWEERLPYERMIELLAKLDGLIQPAYCLHQGAPVDVDYALECLGEHGHHGAIDRAEGVIRRVETLRPASKESSEKEWGVDFLAKYVRSDKVDGCYLPGIGTASAPVWNDWIGDKAWRN